MFWIIILIIFIIFMIIFFSPIRLFFSYNNDNINIFLKYFFLKFNIYPKNIKKKKQKEKNKKNESEIKLKSKKSFFPEDNKEKIYLILDILKSIKKSGRLILKLIKIKKIFIDYIISDLDAYECALKFGKTNIVVYNALSYLNCFVRLQKKYINIECVYNKSECEYNTSFVVYLTPAAALGAILVFFKAFLVNNKKSKEKVKYSAKYMAEKESTI